MKKMVWSDSLDEMVVASFTYKKHRYEWNDVDCVYYDETEGDESYLMDVPENAIIDEEEKEMTREEKLYSMTMKMLVIEAEKAGVKINKKGKKEDAVNKILEAEREEKTMKKEVTRQEVNEAVEKAIAAIEDAEDVLEPVVEIEAEDNKKEAPAPKKERKPRTKKTFESLLANVPVLGRVSIQTNGKKRNAVHICSENGKRRIFGYDGAVIVVTRPEYLKGKFNVEGEPRNYGWRVAPTTENMIALQRNYLATLA